MQVATWTRNWLGVRKPTCASAAFRRLLRRDPWWRERAGSGSATKDLVHIDARIRPHVDRFRARQIAVLELCGDLTQHTREERRWESGRHYSPADPASVAHRLLVQTDGQLDPATLAAFDAADRAAGGVTSA